MTLRPSVTTVALLAPAGGVRTSTCAGGSDCVQTAPQIITHFVTKLRFSYVIIDLIKLTAVRSAVW